MTEEQIAAFEAAIWAWVEKWEEGAGQQEILKTNDGVHQLSYQVVDDPATQTAVYKIGIMAPQAGTWNEKFQAFDPQPTGDLLDSLLDEFDRIKFLPSGRIEFRLTGSETDDTPMGEWMSAGDISFELGLPPAQWDTIEKAQAHANELNELGGDQYEGYRDTESGFYRVRPVKGGRQEDPTDRFWQSSGAAQAAIEGQGLTATHQPVFDGSTWRIQAIPQATDGRIVRGDTEEYGLPKGSFVVIQPDGSIAPFRFGEQPLTEPKFHTDPNTGRQYMRGSESDPWRLVTDKNMTFEQLMTNALTDQSLSPDQQIATAMRYWNFKNQPTDKQRLDAALQLATSPADYLTLMAISRGEVEPIVSNPFDATGKLQRVAPLAGFLQDAAQKFFGTFGTEVAAGTRGFRGEAPPPFDPTAGSVAGRTVITDPEDRIEPRRVTNGNGVNGVNGVNGGGGGGGGGGVTPYTGFRPGAGIPGAPGQTLAPGLIGPGQPNVQFRPGQGMPGGRTIPPGLTMGTDAGFLSTDPSGYAPISAGPQGVLELEIRDIDAEIERLSSLMAQGGDEAFLESDAPFLEEMLAWQYYRRGRAYGKLGQYEKSIMDYDTAIQLDPGQAGFYNDRGNSYYNLGQEERALQDYDAALRIDPEYKWALSNRGTFRDRLGYGLTDADFLGSRPVETVGPYQRPPPTIDTSIHALADVGQADWITDEDPAIDVAKTPYQFFDPNANVVQVVPPAPAFNPGQGIFAGSPVATAGTTQMITTGSVKGAGTTTTKKKVKTSNPYGFNPGKY